MCVEISHCTDYTDYTAASLLLWISNLNSFLYKFVKDILHYSIKHLLGCNTHTWCAAVTDVVTCHSQMEHIVCNKKNL